MVEENIFFKSENLTVEGRFAEGTGHDAVVVTHPHPLYGGDMFNPVVEAAARTFHRAGFATLRFNFRGVGSSEGQFGDGAGEQEDVRAAEAFLRDRGLQVRTLTGYSFGAWVIALLAADAGTRADLVFISPPVAFIDFSAVKTLPGLQLVIAGGEDDFAPAQTVRQLTSVWNPDAVLDIIDHADHFFWGFHEKLESCLAKHIAGLKAG